MKELKVGQRVTITLEAVEQNDCEGCIFNGEYCDATDIGLECSLSDGKSIIFKAVKE